MPFICKIRTDIADGVLQILDLTPNSSQRNLIYEPAGQTKYVGRVVSGTVALNGTAVAKTVSGLAAYLLDNVIDGVSGVTITPAVANDGAAGLIAILDAGGVLDLAAINADLIATGGAGAATDITAGGSTGTVAGVLQVLAGGQYTLPAGSVVGGLAAGAELGSFGAVRHTYESGSLNISLGEGHLSEFADANYSYKGVTGAAVVVYADDGTLLS